MSLEQKVDAWVRANRGRILDTIGELVRIRTENLPPGGNEKPGINRICIAIQLILLGNLLAVR